MLDTELAAMAAESYQRAYGAMVQVQMLSELEEVRSYLLPIHLYHTNKRYFILLSTTMINYLSLFNPSILEILDVF